MKTFNNLKAVFYFRKKTPSQMFDKVLDTLLSQELFLTIRTFYGYRNLGVWDIEFTPVTIGYDFKQFKPTVRISATKVVNGVPLHFEVIMVVTGFQKKV